VSDAAEPAPADGDAAWVRVPAPLAPDELRTILTDPEFIFRLNPYYHVRDFRRTGPASFNARFRNDSNEQDLELGISVEAGNDGALTLRYDRGIKDRTVFAVEPAPAGSLLTVTDFYDRVPEDERRERMGEVDRSLPAWGNALRRYLLRWKRWSWLPGWRWYIHGPWKRMGPRARSIVWLLWVISIAEFVFFLFVLLIYVIEY
jgi:hypothetical protein